MTWNAVTKMIGVRSQRGCWWISVAVSNPSIPGMLTSSRMTAKSSFKRRWSASTPECARTRSWPSGIRIVS